MYRGSPPRGRLNQLKQGDQEVMFKSNRDYISFRDISFDPQGNKHVKPSEKYEYVLSIYTSRLDLAGKCEKREKLAFKVPTSCLC